MGWCRFLVVPQVIEASFLFWFGVYLLTRGLIGSSAMAPGSPPPSWLPHWAAKVWKLYKPRRVALLVGASAILMALNVAFGIIADTTFDDSAFLLLIHMALVHERGMSV